MEVEYYFHLRLTFLSPDMTGTVVRRRQGFCRCDESSGHHILAMVSEDSSYAFPWNCANECAQNALCKVNLKIDYFSLIIKCLSWVVLDPRQSLIKRAKITSAAV